MIENWGEWSKEKVSNFRNRTETQGAHTKKICDEHLKIMGVDVIDKLFRFDLAKYYDAADAEAIYQRIISSNCGGFTTYNKDIRKYSCYTNGHVIKTFDVNSMYPYIMIGNLPYGEIMTIKPMDGLPYTT